MAQQCTDEYQYIAIDFWYGGEKISDLITHFKLTDVEQEFDPIPKHTHHRIRQALSSVDMTMWKDDTVAEVYVSSHHKPRGWRMPIWYDRVNNLWMEREN